MPLMLAEREGTRTLRMGVTHRGRQIDRRLSHQRPLRICDGVDERLG